MPTLKNKNLLIHDCDPGQDDALALIMSFVAPEWDVIAITTVGGNANVEKCTINARKIAALCDQNIPVYTGAQAPLKRKLVTLPDVFGACGMAGADDLTDPGPRTNVETNTNAVDYLVETLSHTNQPVIFCATGPLTNLALALQINPSIADNISHLVLMGGCVYPEPLRGEMGNITVEGTSGKAEYNFATDPEAAAIVYTSAIKRISMIGLNVTRGVLFNSVLRDRLYSLNNRVATKAADILSTVGKEDIKAYRDQWRVPNDPVRAIHDAVAVAYLDKPHLFTVKKTHVKIVVGAPPEIAGQSLPVEAKEDGASRFPVEVVTGCDAAGFFDLILERLASYNA